MYYRNYIVLFDNLVAGIIHNRNVKRRNRPIIVKISFSTILVLGLGPGPCVGAVLVMAGAGRFYSGIFYARSIKKIPTVSNDDRVGYHADRRTLKFATT